VNAMMLALLKRGKISQHAQTAETTSRERLVTLIMNKDDAYLRVTDYGYRTGWKDPDPEKILPTKFGK
jgi:hypothetical protein